MVSLHSAYHDATPMVMLVGQVERKDFGRLALQEQNYSRLLSDVTKLVIEVNEPEQASEAIARAFHLAESGTPGPVAVILPEDIFDENHRRRTGPAAPARAWPGRAPPISTGWRTCWRRPSGRWSWSAARCWPTRCTTRRCSPTCAGFAEDWMLPICPTHRRPQLFDARHPNYGGYMGIRVPPALIDEMKRADLMVALGERLTDTVSQSYSFPAAPQPQLPLVHVWPDANEVGRVWRPDLGMPCQPARGDARRCWRAARRRTRRSAGWVDGLHAIHRRLLEKTWEPTTDGINFAAIVCEVDKHLAPDATVTSDAGNFGSFIHRYIGFKPGQVFLSSVVGAMGSGMPMAVAATLRRPGTQVVAFMGDGGALMMGNEIATACQYGGNPIMIISDNCMYGTIGMHSYVRYPDRTFMDGNEADQSGFRRLGTVVRRRGHHHPRRERSRRRHRAGLRGEDQAGGGALPDLGDPDERVAAVSGGAAALGRSRPPLPSVHCSSRKSGCCDTDLYTSRQRHQHARQQYQRTHRPTSGFRNCR